jgi:phage shock protein C
VKKLERSRGDRVLFGVCGGFGRYFGVDGDLVRVVWIASILAGGVGLIPYIAAVFLVPEGQDEAERGDDRLGKNVGLVLIALAGIFVVRQLGVDLTWGVPFWGWRFLVPLLFITAGILLVWPGTRAALGFSSDRKLHRAVSDRVLAGVAGGIAHAADVDPNLVRLAFVLATVVTSGLALLLYLLLVVVIPEEPVPGSPVAPATPPSTPPDASTPPPAASEPGAGGEEGPPPGQDAAQAGR